MGAESAGDRSAGTGTAPTAEAPRPADSPAAGAAAAATHAAATLEAASPGARTRKYRQAAFVYLHVGLLYEFGVYVLWQQGLLPTNRGPAWLWLTIGAAITAAVFWGLWSWRNAWFARVIWAFQASRLPALIGGAFFPAADAILPPSFYLTALAVVLINLWMLARAAWEL